MALLQSDTDRCPICFGCRKPNSHDQFIAPSLIALKNSDDGKVLEKHLLSKFQFVFDGIRWVDPVEINGAPGFQFPSKRGKKTRLLGRHYVHRSGIAFVRVLEDENGIVAFLWLQNRFQIGHNEDLKAQAAALLGDLKAFVALASIETCET